jgi:hypothetical protein
MSIYDWEEERGAGLRRLICHRPSGYEARIVVAGNEVSARLWRPREGCDSFTLAPAEYPPGDVPGTVDRIRAEIEDRLDEIESGHS